MAVGGATAALVMPAQARQDVQQQKTGRKLVPIQEPLQRHHVEGKRVVTDALGLMPHATHTDPNYFGCWAACLI